MSGKVEYANLLSRILLSSRFERQFVIPEEPSRVLERLLMWHEKLLLRVDTSSIDVDRPILMIALPRAGASILQNILCTHPDIAYITNTMHAFRKCFCSAVHFQRKFRINARAERYIGDSVMVDLETPADGVAFWFEWLKEDPNCPDYVEHTIEDFSDQEIKNIKDAIRKMVYCFGGRARFFSKNPMLLPQMLLLKDLFPDARFVHVVRDARMAANSLVKLYRLENEKLERLREKGRLPLAADKPWLIYPRTPKLAENVEKYGPDDIRTTAHLWNDAETFVNQNKDKLPTFYEVRYEDILVDAQKEVLGILEFCEVSEPGKDNTEFWQKLGEFGKIRHKNVYGDFEVVESICGDNMRRYGYS